MRAWNPLLLALWCVGCSDYGLKGDKDEGPGGQDSPLPDEDSEPPEDSDPPPPPDCDDVVFPAWSWWGSMPFTTEADPTDGSGSPWYSPAFVQVDYSTVSLPDQNIPTGQDRVFRATFTLATLPPNLSLNLQSDDGLRVYVNGTAVGQWGGAWQEEGCVNDLAGCGTTESVEPVDVTGLLVAGENLVAARVSNPVVGSYFSITPECIAGR